MNKYLDIAPRSPRRSKPASPSWRSNPPSFPTACPTRRTSKRRSRSSKLFATRAQSPPPSPSSADGSKPAFQGRDRLPRPHRRGHPKASCRDLPVLVAQGKDGACTVTTTMMIADMAGIRVFATGGIGGVHRGAQETFDISADLEELANTSVMVICAGAKSILDLGLTLEYLETHGVTVIGYGTSELPAFYTRKSGFGVDYELDTPEQLAKAFHVKRELGLRGGLLVTNPIPEEYSMDKEVIDKAIAEAVEDAKKDGIHGKATTPYLLAKIKDLTGGDSLDSNIQLVFNNARLGAAAAVELSKLEK